MGRFIDFILTLTLPQNSDAEVAIASDAGLYAACELKRPGEDQEEDSVSGEIYDIAQESDGGGSHRCRKIYGCSCTRRSRDYM